MRKVHYDETDRMLSKVVFLDQGPHVFLHRDDGAEEEETRQLDDARLTTHFAEVAAVSSWTTDSGFGYISTVAGSNRGGAGALDYVAQTSQNDARKDAHDEIVDTHDQHNGNDGEILQLVTLPDSVPNSFFHEFDTEHEDQRTDQTYGDEANHCGTGHPNCSGCCGQQNTCSATVTAVLNKQNAIRIYKIVLLYVNTILSCLLNELT
jgi:hypothetical protein